MLAGRAKNRSYCFGRVRIRVHGWATDINQGGVIRYGHGRSKFNPLLVSVCHLDSQLVTELPNSEPGRGLIRQLIVVRHELQIQMIQLRIAVAVWPPEAGVGNVQLSELAGCEPHGLGFAGLQGHRLLETGAFETALQFASLNESRAVAQ